MGIEPTPSAWKAEVLPLNYTRLSDHYSQPTPVLTASNPHHHRPRKLSTTASAFMVEGAGFEPAYSERTDLQSVAFNHSATPPKKG